MNKLTILVLVLAFAGLAITFDWGGSRSIADSALDSISDINSQLQETGDKLSDLSDKASDVKEAAQ